MENSPHRRSLRLKDYDYSQAGYYFVTICAIGRKNLFGKIVEVDDPVHLPEMKTNEIGEIVCECWNKTNEIYDNVKTDVFCLMPNHVHGVIELGEIGGQSRPPLQKIIQGLKSVSTRMCFEYGYKALWQQNYYEHIVRSNHELQKVREYILSNPAKWQEDEYFS